MKGHDIDFRHYRCARTIEGYYPEPEAAVTVGDIVVLTVAVLILLGIIVWNVL